MSVRLFVGNLPYETSEEQLRQHFAAVAAPTQVFLPVDRETGRPRGFAFVEFADQDAAQQAIDRFNSQPFNGRTLSVSEARARESRPSFGSRPPTAGPSGPPRPMTRPDRPPPRSGGFGSDAPESEDGQRRRRMRPAPRPGAKAEKPRRGPIPIRTSGQVFSVDDADEEAAVDTDFDDFATSLDEDAGTDDAEDEVTEDTDDDLTEDDER